MDVAAILKHKGRHVETAPPETPLIDITKRLAQLRIGAIVIVDGLGRVIGIVSERDVIRWIATEGPDALRSPVSSVMTNKVVDCSLDETLDQIMERMTTRRFRHLPVVKEGRLVGIISIGDVVKHHIAEVEHDATALRQYIGAV